LLNNAIPSVAETVVDFTPATYTLRCSNPGGTSRNRHPAINIGGYACRHQQLIHNISFAVEYLH
jgi:hypothetical protein